MSDMRDSIFVRDDSARFSETPSLINEPIRDDVVIVDDGGLGDYHINNDVEEEGSRRSKLFAGVAVAAVFAIGGAFAINGYMKDQPVVADQNLPSPSAPSKTAAMPPPAASEAEATSPSATAPAPAAMAPAPATREATVNAPRATSVPRPSSITSTPAPLTPEQQYTAPAITPAPVPASVPEPVSPTPPASVQAGNPALNQQSADQPAEQAVTPASQAAAPVQPEAAPAQPAAPAPADTPAQ